MTVFRFVISKAAVVTDLAGSSVIGADVIEREAAIPRVILARIVVFCVLTGDGSAVRCRFVPAEGMPLLHPLAREVSIITTTVSHIGDRASE